MDLFYITYQQIPSITAHGVHTFSLIKNFSKNNVNVHLIYPIRNEFASDDINILKERYSFDNDFKIIPTKHYLPFDRIKILKKYLYIFSHFLWSFFISKKFENKKFERIFTLSDWVFYFMSRKKKKVVFECHNLTTLRKYLIKKSLEINPNSHVVFINSLILEDSKQKLGSNIHILESGYDDDLFFSKGNNSGKLKIVFSGNLLRFGQDRGIKKIIEYFADFEQKKECLLNIYGGPEEYVEHLKEEFENDTLENINFFGHLNRLMLSDELNNSDIGILTNTQSEHSDRHTSPLKYFEYLGSGLKVIATDVTAHRVLPKNENIKFFDLNDKDSFHKALSSAIKTRTNITSNDLYKLTNDFRVKKLIEIYS